MVNANVEGKKYPATEAYLVGREKIREFAHAVMSTNPVNHDVFAAQAAGYTDVVAPPTFAVVIQERSLATVLADPEANIDFSRVVHGDQRFVHVRPIVAGDLLTSQLTVASVKSLGAHSMVTFETQIFDAASKQVCIAISTLVVRGDE
jgi:acyl dehydratase